MVDFRKWFPVLAVVAVMMLTAVSASAQTAGPAFSCTANAGVPPVVRAEGITELTGDVILNCTGGQPAGQGGNAPTAVPLVNIEIFLNTNITSRILNGVVSEATLTIDEPTPAQQRLCSAASVSPVVPCGATPNPGNITGVDYLNNSAVSNVYLGEQSGPNRVVWRGVPIDAPGTTATRVIRITNVRANASQLGVSSTLVPSQIITFISATSSTSIPINNPQQTTGFVLTGLNFSLRNASGSGGLSSNGASFLQCVDVNDDIAGDPSDDLSTGLSGHVRFGENFASSFKVRNVSGTPNANVDSSPAPTAQDQLGSVYNTESGFYNPVLAISNGGRSAGLADHGTRLMARWSNIPQGVQVFVGVYEAGRDETNSRVRLVSTDANGAGSFSAVAATSSDEGGLAPVSLTGGAGVAVWEVMNADPIVTETIDIAFAFAFVSNTSSNLPALGTGSVNGNFAPISTVTTASSSAPIPRFVDTATNRNIIVINACSTNLLFPFVTNQSGFDTGIAISNTSQDPFGTAGQSGACVVNYYGNTTGGGAAPAAQTSGVVASGAQLLFVVSTGGNLGITGTPGFQGYIIAQCAFQFAHGFAFVSDGPIGAANVAEGYLALVMDESIGSRTGFASETLGH